MVAPDRNYKLLKKSQLFIKFTSVCVTNLKFVDHMVIYNSDSKLTLVIVNKYRWFESCTKF